MSDQSPLRIVRRTSCWLRGHSWVEMQLGEEKMGLNAQAECTRCGKTVSGIAKYTLGGPKYPEIDDE